MEGSQGAEDEEEEEEENQADEFYQGGGPALPARDLPLLVNPEPHDVLLGQGRGHTNHPGNQRFRAHIIRSVNRYEAAGSREEKTRMTSQIVDSIREMGRFLKYDKNRRGWMEIDQEAARKKVGQSLRSRRPTRTTSSEIVDPFPSISQATLPEQEQQQRKQRPQPSASTHAAAAAAVAAAPGLFGAQSVQAATSQLGWIEAETGFSGPTKSTGLEGISFPSSASLSKATSRSEPGEPLILAARAAGAQSSEPQAVQQQQSDEAGALLTGQKQQQRTQGKRGRQPSESSRGAIAAATSSKSGPFEGKSDEAEVAQQRWTKLASGPTKSTGLEWSNPFPPISTPLQASSRPEQEQPLFLAAQGAPSQSAEPRAHQEQESDESDVLFTDEELRSVLGPFNESESKPESKQGGGSP